MYITGNKVMQLYMYWFVYYCFYLQIVSEEVVELQRNHATTMSKLAQFKRRHLELSHRVLEVL